MDGWKDGGGPHEPWMVGWAISLILTVDEGLTGLLCRLYRYRQVGRGTSNRDR